MKTYIIRNIEKTLSVLDFHPSEIAEIIESLKPGEKLLLFADNEKQTVSVTPSDTDAHRYVIHNETYKPIMDSVFSDIAALEKAGHIEEM